MGFVQPDYKARSVSLASARSNEAVEVNARMIYFNVIPSPCTIRIGSPNADPISLRVGETRKLVLCREKEDRIQHIYLTNDAGSGSLEFYASPELDVDFSGAGGTSADIPLVTYVPGGRSASNFNVSFGGDYSAGNQAMSAVLTGGAQASTPLVGTAGVRINGGVRLALVQSASASDTARAYPNVATPTYNIDAVIQPTASYPREFDDWGMCVEDGVAVDYVNTTGGFLRSVFGVGWSLYTGAGGYAQCFLGFEAKLEGGDNWHAEARATSGAPFEPVAVDLGMSVKTARRLRLEWGFKGGSPFLRWKVNGVTAYEATVPFSQTFVQDVVHCDFRVPFYSMWKLDNTNTDWATMMFLLGTGCKVATFTP